MLLFLFMYYLDSVMDKISMQNTILRSIPTLHNKQIYKRYVYIDFQVVFILDGLPECQVRDYHMQ